MTVAIVNPRAASGAALRRWKNPGADQVFFTKGPGHATELARAIAPGCDLLIVGGGDGTLNEVVNGIADLDAPPRIALVPLGTGGDFARTLRRLRAAHTDVFRARYLDHDGRPAERCFVNAAGIGLAALAARRAPALPIRARYLAAALPILAAGTTFSIVLRVDDGPPLPFEITTAAVANGQFQGGGIRIAPDAAIDDALADVTIVQPVSLFEVATRLPILYNGRLHTHPQVRHFRGERILVESAAAVPLELDGETVGTLPLDVTRLARQLVISHRAV